MRDNLNYLQRQLSEKVKSGNLQESDLQDAMRVAKSKGDPASIALYAAVKRAFAGQYE